jgi:anti-sigma factor RsiW
MTRRDFSIRDIHMALDGELPGDERDDFQHWLDANPDMKALNGRLAADRDALGAAFASVLDEPIPASMTKLLAGEAEASRPRARFGQMAAAAALLLFGGAAGYVAGLSGLGFQEGPGPQLAENAIAAHEFFASQQTHVVEVAAGGDNDYLKTWLANQTGMKLVIPDLTAEGFELLGGRLLPAGKSLAARLLYQDKNGKRLSIYLTPDSDVKSRGAYSSADDGVRAMYWLDKGYGCAIVAPLTEDEMNVVARGAWKQLAAGLQI